MSKRLVVVGAEHRFDVWLRQQLPEVRAIVVPVRRWSDMLGHRHSIVQFMPDWRQARDEAENALILAEAEMLEAYRAGLLNPFTHASRQQPLHEQPQRPDHGVPA